MLAKCIRREGASALYKVTAKGMTRPVYLDVVTIIHARCVSVTRCNSNWETVEQSEYYKTSSHVEALKAKGCADVVFAV